MGEIAYSGYDYEAYLNLEAESGQKYEYHDGFIVAMAGGIPEHGQIAANFITSTNIALKAQQNPCIVYTSDVKVHIQASKRTFYPDVSIVCNKPETSELDTHAITNPLLIVEVLSESTESFDRGVKFAHYRKLESLQEYVLIKASEILVDSYFLTEAGAWEIRTYTDIADTILLKSIGCEVKVSDLYYLVEGIKRP